MAHANIDQRRAYIKTRLDKGEQIGRKQAIEIAKFFGVSSSAIQADVRRLQEVKGEVIIYALCDPDTNHVFYVGQTENTLRARAQQHITATRFGYERNAVKREWIASLISANKEPIWVVLELCPHRYKNDREKWWINHYIGLGAKLTNAVKYQAAAQ